VGGLSILVAISYQEIHGLAHAGWSTANYFSYFTELSNLFAAAVLLYGALYVTRPRSTAVELLRGASVVYMLTTGIVFAVLLSGAKLTTPWVSTIVHQVMPIVVALDWMIDPPQRRLALRHTSIWLGFPLVYVAYTLIRGALVDWYPYFFVDPTRHGGYLRVIAACLAISAGIIALILLVTWVGNTLASARGRARGQVLPAESP
jgi:hypothetical protein